MARIARIMGALCIMCAAIAPCHAATLGDSVLVCRSRTVMEKLRAYAVAQDNVDFFRLLGASNDICQTLNRGDDAAADAEQSSGGLICVRTPDHPECRWADERQAGQSGL